MNVPYQPNMQGISARKGKGKWQKFALKLLKGLYAKQIDTLEKSGYPISNAAVKIDDWKEACIEFGFPKDQGWRVFRQLVEYGVVKMDRHHAYLVDTQEEDDQS